MMAFVHEGLAHMCSVATSAAVAFGVGNTLGNKGAVGMLLRIGSTKMIFVNAHLAAHQNAVRHRNAEFHKVNNQMPALLSKKESFYMGKVAGSNNDLTMLSLSSGVAPAVAKPSPQTGPPLGIAERPLPSEPNPTPVAAAAEGQPDNDKTHVLSVDRPDKIGAAGSTEETPAAAAEANDSDDEPEDAMSPLPESASELRGEASSSTIMGGKGLDQTADVVIFMGDLNYRIQGNRLEAEHSLCLLSLQC